MRASRRDVVRLMQYFNQTSSCSAHGIGGLSSCKKHRKSPYAFSSAALTKDYAFEFKSSNLRFGRGVTSEVGMDLLNWNVKKVLVVTDPNLAKLPPVTKALDSLTEHGVNYEVYDQVRCEPTDSSFQAAIQFAKDKNVDSFVAIGGGSVIDTTKAANLYSTHRDYDFYDFINAPIGKGLPVPGPLKPMIAIPTTTGTGSETTGVAVFDIESMSSKTGIANRLMTPNLALVDSENAQYQPNGVVTSSGFDVLCHALESYTNLNFDDRSPRPKNPKERPAYQGANPIADIWCRVALPMIHKYFIRAANDPEDFEAREQMQFASCFAGMGFGTAGVHLCHGMSYPISGMTHHRDYVYRDYEHLEHAIIPHGVSVVVSSPAVFEFTCPAKPEKHRDGAIMLGVPEEKIKMTDVEDIGKKLRDQLLYYMDELKIPLGLKKCGFSEGDVDQLVEGTMPQQRILQLAPRPIDPEIIGRLFENCMAY